MKNKKPNDLRVLLGYAGRHKGLTFLGLGLSAAAMILGMLPYICIWLVARDLIAVAPNWTQAAWSATALPSAPTQNSPNAITWRIACWSAPAGQACSPRSSPGGAKP